MLNTILLQSSMPSSWANILMIVALIAVFYFMMIRPQQKRQNEIKKFREGLKVNDPVVTAGGIYGKIKGIDDTTFNIEIAQGVRITVDKGSVYPSAQQAARDAAEKENK